MATLATRMSCMLSGITLSCRKPMQRCLLHTKTPLQAEQPVSPFKTISSTATETKPRRQSLGSINSLLSLDTPGAQRKPSGPSVVEQVAMRNKLNDLNTSFRESIKQAQENAGLARLQYRKWQPGDLYTPHDLTPREMLPFRSPKPPTRDIFDALGINPINEYKNPVLLAEFMTSNGRIKHPRETGLRKVNQRKLAKAIRRATGMGLMPTVHVHPEMLRRPGPDASSKRYQWR